MQERTKKRFLLFIAIGFVALLGAWWYSGFSLDFMRFFAAENRVSPTPTPPPGCYYQEVQCFQAPCPPILVCPSPSPSCRPRPACLDARPACLMPEPEGGWCPPETKTVQCAPSTQTVSVGGTANLSASGGNNSYTWYAPGSVQNTDPLGQRGPTVQVTYSTAGIKKVTVESGRADSSGAIDSVACTIVVQP